MIFDYIELDSKEAGHICNLEFVREDLDCLNGWKRFKILKTGSLDVWVHESTNRVKVKGSVPYFWSGQNLFFRNDQFFEALDYCSQVLDVDLFSFCVTRLEFGSAVQTSQRPEIIIKSHLSIRGKQFVNFKHGIGWENGKYRVKMYDAGRNFRNKVRVHMRDNHVKDGYDPNKNYVKFEIDHKTPSINLGVDRLKAIDIFSPNLTKLFEQNLLEIYKGIALRSTPRMHTSKKQLTSATLPLMLLIEYANRLGCNAEQDLKNLINSIPQSVMNSYDKRARKRQLKQNLSGISLPETSHSILPALLAKASAIR